MVIKAGKRGRRAAGCLTEQVLTLGYDMLLHASPSWVLSRTREEGARCPSCRGGGWPAERLLGQHPSEPARKRRSPLTQVQCAFYYSTVISVGKAPNCTRQ